MDKTGKNKNTVLIIDDAELNRALLGDILALDYNVLEAADGETALATLEERWTEIDLVLLDVVMPGMDGFELLTRMNRNSWLSSTPVIMISADGSPENIDRAYDLGATDYITRPFDEKTVLYRVRNTIRLYAKQQALENLVAEQIMEKERSNFQMVEILSNVVEFRNGESGLHVQHVRLITDVLLQTVRRRCPQYGLTSAKIAVIANASALHDVGKISIDEKILNKPGRLTPEEFEIMKTHTVIGARMLEETPHQGEGDDGFLHIAHDICRWHHERYDGRGYPDGLVGEEIPISAQVVALADVYDALTATRVYKAAIEPEKALQMILDGQCGTFNPVLLDCLVECAPRLNRELDFHNAGPISSLEIHRVAGELLERGGLDSSRHALGLLEQAQERFSFYAEVTADLIFEYDRVGRRIRFSRTAARRLGLEEELAQPDAQTAVQALGSALPEIQDALDRAGENGPDVEGEYTLTLPDGPRRFHIRMRPLWNGEERRGWSRVVGKLTELDA